MSIASSPRPGQAEATPELVRTIFAEILGTGDIAMDENFFEVGGNSILALTLMSRVEECWMAKISLMDVIRNPTPTLLAALIARLAPDRGEAGR